MDEDTKKKKRRKMPSAPIKAPQSTIKGIGKKGITTGGLDPSIVSPAYRLGNPRAAQVVGKIRIGNSRRKS